MGGADNSGGARRATAEDRSEIRFAVNSALQNPFVNFGTRSLIHTVGMPQSAHCRKASAATPRAHFLLVQATLPGMSPKRFLNL